MTWYHAADGQQAGPFTEEQFRELIASGKIQPTTLVWEARLPNWMPLSQVPAELLPTPAAVPAGSAPPAAADGVVCAECGNTFAPDEVIRIANRNVCGSCKPLLVQRLSEGAAPSAIPGVWVSEQQLFEREYQVEIGTALERSWNVFKNNAAPIIGATLLGGLVFLAGWAVVMGVAMFIPFANVVLQSLYVGPLMGGMLYYWLRLARGESASVSDIFAGFSRNFAQLFLASLVQTLLMGACLIPLGIMAAVVGVSFAGMGAGGGGVPDAAGVALIVGFVVLALICFAVMAYLGVGWTHSFLLIIDKRMNFWPAMRLSRRMVNRRWWMSFLLLVVASLISSVGAFACLVGLIVTVPLYYGMKVFFYEDNFRDLQPAQS